MTRAGAVLASTPPAVVTRDLTSISGALDAVVPARTGHNLLIATWNLRAFADLTGKWQAGPKDSPKRDWHAVAVIAEIMPRFDVIAVLADLRPLPSVVSVRDPTDYRFNPIAVMARAATGPSSTAVSLEQPVGKHEPGRTVGRGMGPSAVTGGPARSPPPGTGLSEFGCFRVPVTRQRGLAGSGVMEHDDC